VAALANGRLTPCAQRESEVGRGATRQARGPPGHLLTIARGLNDQRYPACSCRARGRTRCHPPWLVKPTKGGATAGSFSRAGSPAAGSRARRGPRRPVLVLQDGPPISAMLVRRSHHTQTLVPVHLRPWTACAALRSPPQ
jgi:hypothetical protein